MIDTVALIGFGEAGQTFALPGVRAYDLKTDKAQAYADRQVRGVGSVSDALTGATAVLSLVTADQALAVARDCASLLGPGTLWFDMNSVAPGTKRAAAQAIEARGGRYVDVAVMAPVHPAAFAVPLLVAGPHADTGAAWLRAYGFQSVAIAGRSLGDASAIKMIRSVMVKGIEALSAECLLAADRAGVTDAVLASLDASWKVQGWADRVDYNLDRMLAHGLRRAEEMNEAAKTLSDLGVDPAMTRGTIARQRALGLLALSPPQGLGAKLAAINAAHEAEAA